MAGALKRMATAEGEALPMGEKGFAYQYFLKDHLGNVRAVIRDDDTGSPEVIQAKTYYPFGMVFTSEMMQGTIADKTNPYLFNGKEQQERPGLWCDYGARMYDAQLGRWHVVDPMSEKFYLESPYCYVSNSPLLFIDTDGMAKWSINLMAKITTGIFELGTEFLGGSYSAGGVENELSLSISFDDESFDFKFEVGVTKREVLPGGFSLGTGVGGSTSETRENGYTLEGGVNLKTGSLVGNVVEKDEKVFKTEETGTIGILTNGQKEGEGEKQVVGIKDGGVGVGVVGVGAGVNVSRQETPEETDARHQQSIDNYNDRLKNEK